MKAKTKKAWLTIAKLAGSCIAVGTASILGAVVFDGSTKTLTDKLELDKEQKQLEAYFIYSDEQGNYQTWCTDGFRKLIVE